MKFSAFIYICATATTTASIFTTSKSALCRCFPDETCWPPRSAWDGLNATVGGRLVATIPLGSPCHDPVYNATECASLQNQWLDAQLHMSSSSSVMAPFFANQSCDPFQPKARACLLGNYVDYAVNLSTSNAANEVTAAVRFAHQHNIRFVIRNTGHDYLGKSTGAGALSVWTHYLKDIEFLDWSDENYNGKAIKMGAGVQGYEAMEAAKNEGLVVVGGECPTVGIAGGYSQGGGHSALSTSFGLGADQTLSWEVVTAEGKLVTASRSENSDLYWALSGGGGGTYGVVLSLISKAHPDNIVGGASLTFLSSSTTIETFYEGVTTFHTFLPAIIDAGAMVVYFLSNTSFEIFALTAYGKTSTEVKEMLSNFISALNAFNITYTVSYSQSTNYVDHYNTYLGPLPFGDIQVGVAQYGDRLIPRSSIENNLTAFMAAIRNITEDGCAYSGVALNVSSPAIKSRVSNAILPAWREALIHAILRTPWNFTAPWSEMIALQNKMTYKYIPQLEAVTPGSGAYINEADFRQPNWQNDFFGANYEKLLTIKNKWDPQHLFYATKAVGSEIWTVADDGRMCKTAQEPFYEIF